MDDLVMANLAVGFSIFIPGVLSQVIKIDKPNKYIGYRTKRSLKNEKTWAYGNNLASKMMPLTSLIGITFQLFAYFNFDLTTSLLTTPVVFTCSLLSGFIWVETRLSKAFNADGSPRSSISP